jgi:hypothetical protein
MSLYATTHLYNVAAGREAEFAAWFEGQHRADLARLRGFRSAERFELTPEQIMPDIAQPWRFLSLYDFDYPAPEIDLPARDRADLFLPALQRLGFRTQPPARQAAFQPVHHPRQLRRRDGGGVSQMV